MSHESCHIYERVTSHIWARHVTSHMAECLALEVFVTQSMSHVSWVMSHIWASHVAYMSESCHTYERVTSRHTWPSALLFRCSWLSQWVMSHESCHTYERVTSHIWVSRVTHGRVPCPRGISTESWVMSHICTSHILRSCGIWGGYD